MKILHITDPHLVAPGVALHGLDPHARLQACVADICEHHRDAAFCVITGDLADAGERSAYVAMKKVLQALPMPWYPLLGNHDRREPYREVFADAPRDPNGFVQAVLRNDAGHFILLDTLSEGEHGGRYCAPREAWLAAQLDAAGTEPVYLFMHHPPFGIGLPSLDRMALLEPQRMAALLGAHPNIRHLFFGHVHRPVCGSWQGIAFSTLRGLNHQVPFDLRTAAPVPRSHEPPAYAVAFIAPGQVTVHFHDFLDKTRLAEKDQ